MDDGRVVASAHEFSDARGRHPRVFLRQIHRHLSCRHQLALAALAIDRRRAHTEVVAYGFENVIDGERAVVGLHGALDDALGQPHVDGAVIDHAVGHQRIHCAFEVAHAAVGRLGDVLHHLVGNLQAVALDFVLENVDAELRVGLFELGDEAAREAREQPVGHSLQIDGRTVAGQNDAPTVAEQVVEDVEERLLRLVEAYPLLNVIDDEHVDGLVEMDEVVERVLAHGVGVLHLEEACADVEHALLRIELCDTVADGVHEMRLAAARRAIDEHRVELRVLRMLGDAHAYATRQFVAVALDEVRERLSRIELRVKFLRLCGVEHRRRLVGAAFGLLAGVFRGVALQHLRDAVLAVGHHAIGQLHTFAKASAEYFSKQVHIVLLEVLIHKWAGYLNQHRLRLLVERFEGDGLEPCIILLL